jgi:hypothetical protein
MIGHVLDGMQAASMLCMARKLRTVALVAPHSSNDLGPEIAASSADCKPSYVLSTVLSMPCDCHSTAQLER